MHFILFPMDFDLDKDIFMKYIYWIVAEWIKVKI